MSSRPTSEIITQITSIANDIISTYGREEIPVNILQDAATQFTELWTEYETSLDIELADARLILDQALSLQRSGVIDRV